MPLAATQEPAGRTRRLGVKVRTLSQASSSGGCHQVVLIELLIKLAEPIRLIGLKRVVNTSDEPHCCRHKLK